MAKRTTSSPKKIDIVDLSAYVALVFAAFIFLITAIMRIFEAESDIIGRIVSIMTLVKDIAVIIALGLGGWNFARKRGIGVRVCYYIALVVYIVCLITGVALNF